jgi:endonuclease-3 related protein
MASIVQEVYQRLYDAFGPQHWWPGDTPFEIMVGAVLTQNTNWKNVERAIANLRQADLLEPKALYATPLEELEELIRPAGYYRIKARRLRNLLELVVKRYGGSLEKMFASDPAALREQLLAVRGIGPETADSILLYAGGIPVFVIDAYTYRIFARHGWVEPDADYHRLQEYFHSQLADDAAMFNEYHALLVRLGKHYCHKRRPRCPGCPLEELLPSGGPAEVG